MATPPFNINQLVPQDNDIASQFPATERTFRDVVESWFLIDGNTQGRKNKVGLDWVADPAGTNSVTTVWADSAGALRFRVGTGNVQTVGVPPATVVDYVGATEPEGWLFPYGQAISRSTYSALFAVISTTFGIGDGTTTFNLPDYRGRVGVGKDNMGGAAASRITTAGSSMDGLTLGAVGGAQTQTLTTLQIPGHTHVATVTDPGHTHDAEGTTASPAAGANFLRPTTGTAVVGQIHTATTGITVANANAGGGEAHINVQPGIIVNKLIKF